jgi:phosphatidate cytidylyltransferase
MVPNYLLVVLALIWINDTGAYLVGSAIGKHRLFERISPKKSWEGFFGGLVLAVACAILLGDLLPEYFRVEMTMEMTIIFAVLSVVMATFGDLIESQVKRTLHIKDSGTIIPGHGGLLDRIDSILLAMPTAWILINMLRGIY